MCYIDNIKMNGVANYHGWSLSLVKKIGSTMFVERCALRLKKWRSLWFPKLVIYSGNM
jgi:hypothetical protein